MSTTKAGERLVAEIAGPRYINPDESDAAFVARMVPAIEAEAVRDALTDLRAAVEGLDCLDPDNNDPTWLWVLRSAVLAEIDARMPGGA